MRHIHPGAPPSKHSRHAQLASWTADLATPKVTWLPGLFNPQAFLTAVMQVTARKSELPLDKLAVVSDVTKKSVDEIEVQTLHTHTHTPEMHTHTHVEPNLPFQRSRRARVHMSMASTSTGRAGTRARGCLTRRT